MFITTVVLLYLEDVSVVFVLLLGFFQNFVVNEVGEEVTLVLEGVFMVYDVVAIVGVYLVEIRRIGDIEGLAGLPETVAQVLVIVLELLDHSLLVLLQTPLVQNLVNEGVHHVAL